MAIAISTAARSAAADGIVDLIDGGAGAGTLLIFTGAAPATPATADSDPAFGAAASGVATASAITSDTNVDASGTAAHFRIKDSNAVVILQGTVGTSGADINFNTVTFVAGATAAISSLTLTQPAS
jgi:hypothetical protein